MSAIEDELVKATSFVKKEEIPQQEYLQGLIKAVQALSDDEWDIISTEAQLWVNEASNSLNKSEEIKGFFKQSNH